MSQELVPGKVLIIINYYQIYQTKQGVKFELELKNPLVKSFQSFLFNMKVFGEQISIKN